MPPKSRRKHARSNKPRPHPPSLPKKKMSPTPTHLTLDTTSPLTHISPLPASVSAASQTPLLLRQTAPLERPPVSPLTPTKEKENPFTQRQTYTHPTQQKQSGIPQPPLEPIVYDDNPDVIALKSSIAILQIQARNAVRDIRTLSQIKTRAVAEPKEFTDALGNGELGRVGANPPVWGIYENDSDDEGDENVDMDRDLGEGEGGKRKWPALPKPQDVVRCPPINWTQYAVVGDSLDKLHNEQVAQPSGGMPQKLRTNGELMFGGNGVTRQANLGIAAPFDASRDRLEKKKGKKSDGGVH